MKEYQSKELRNIALIGHGGCGKTSVVTALTFASGSSNRLGSVDEGNSLTDFTPDEIDRKISINLSMAYAEWKGVKINLFDTPGYLDFVGEVRSALHVADGALILIHANSGVEVGTDIVWENAEEEGIPRLFFINAMDKEHADFSKVYGQIREKYGKKAVALQLPIGEGEAFRGIVDILDERACLFKRGTTKGEFTEGAIPEEMAADAAKAKEMIVELAAEADDALIEKYLEEGGLSREEVIGGLVTLVRGGELYPVFCGSATKTYGIRNLLDGLVDLVPDPTWRGTIRGTRRNGEEATVEAGDESPFSALIFKTTTEPHIGELSYFRVFSGKVDSGAEVINGRNDKSERLNHLSVIQGKDRSEISTLHTGDIGVVAKLKESHTNDSLLSKGNSILLPQIEFPVPAISVAVEPKSKGDDEKIASGLARLHEEDPTFVSGYNAEIRQTLVSGMGELHLDVIMERLKRKFGVEAVLKKPEIPYRETIRSTAQGQGKYKKQTGGRGQYGDTWIRLEPLERGAGFEFVDAIRGGAIPNKYIPSVEKGVVEAAQRGVLAGYTVVDFRATLYDGSFHNVDSSDMAFKVAGSMAFGKVALDAKPYIIEPVLNVKVIIPDDFLGDVMGDLNSRRGKIMGVDSRGGNLKEINAQVPQAEMYKYSTTLRSLNKGRGIHTRQFSHYDEVPPDIAQKVIAEAEAKKKE
jgi:elongation factor G